MKSVTEAVRIYRRQDFRPLYYELIWIFQGLLSRVAQYKRGSFIRPVGGGSLLRKEEEQKKNQIKRIYFFPSGKEWEGSGELLGTVSYPFGTGSLASCWREGGLNFLGHDSFVILLLMLFYSLLAQDTLCVCVLLGDSFNSIFFSFLCIICSSPPGWMRSSSSSAWRAKPVSTPSTATTPKWPNSATPRRSRLSWSALKVRFPNSSNPF